jgi:hypothetical protein
MARWKPWRGRTGHLRLGLLVQHPPAGRRPPAEAEAGYHAADHRSGHPADDLHRQPDVHELGLLQSDSRNWRFCAQTNAAKVPIQSQCITGRVARFPEERLLTKGIVAPGNGVTTVIRFPRGCDHPSGDQAYDESPLVAHVRGCRAQARSRPRRCQRRGRARRAGHDGRSSCPRGLGVSWQAYHDGRAEPPVAGRPTSGCSPPIDAAQRRRQPATLRRCLMSCVTRVNRRSARPRGQA